MKTAIQEFGIGPWIDVRAVINWIVEELNNTIPAVKNSAVGLIAESPCLSFLSTGHY